MLGLNEWTGGIARMAASTGLLEGKLGEAERSALSSGVAFAALAASLVALEVDMAREADAVDRLTTSFTYLDESADGAKERVEGLENSTMAADFGNEATVRAALNLQALGASAGDTDRILKAVGNTTAANAKGTEEYTSLAQSFAVSLERQAFGHRQIIALARAGVPVTKLLGDQFGYSAAQLETMNLTGPAAVRMLNSVINALNRKYNGALEADLQNIGGATNALRSQWELAKEEIGEPFRAPIAALLHGVTDLVHSFNELGEGPKRAASGILALVTAGAGIYGLVRSFQFGRLAFDTLKSASEKLRAETTKTDAQLDAEAGALRNVGAAMSESRKIAISYIPEIEAVAKAHEHAALAADAQAAAEGRLRGGVAAPAGAAASGVKAAEREAGAAATPAAAGTTAATAESQVAKPAMTAAQKVEAATAGAGTVAVAAGTVATRRAPAAVQGAVPVANEATLPAGQFSAQEINAGHQGITASNAAIPAAEEGILARTFSGAKNALGFGKSAVGAGGEAAAEKLAGEGILAGLTAKLGPAGRVLGKGLGEVAWQILAMEMAADAARFGLSYLPDKGVAGGVKQVGQESIDALTKPFGVISALFGDMQKIWGAIEGSQKRDTPKQESLDQQILDELRKQTAQQQAMVDNLNQTRGGGAIDFSRMNRAAQIDIARNRAFRMGG